MINIPIMIDIETLGVDTKTCPIIQIAARTFGAELPSEYYGLEFERYCSLEYNLLNSRLPEKDTVLWWKDRLTHVQFCIFINNPQAVTLDRLLIDLIFWIEDIKKQPKVSGVTIWSKGADFDLEILQNLAKDFNQKLPYSFRDHRCARTLMECFPNFTKSQTYDKERAHDAKYDCLYQSLVIEKIAKINTSMSLYHTKGS